MTLGKRGKEPFCIFWRSQSPSHTPLRLPAHKIAWLWWRRRWWWWWWWWLWLWIIIYDDDNDKRGQVRFFKCILFINQTNEWRGLSENRCSENPLLCKKNVCSSTFFFMLFFFFNAIVLYFILYRYLKSWFSVKLVHHLVLKVLLGWVKTSEADVNNMHILSLS